MPLRCKRVQRPTQGCFLKLLALEVSGADKLKGEHETDRDCRLQKRHAGLQHGRRERDPRAEALDDLRHRARKG